ncbi:LOW QUALITY PROTEIN: POLR1D isoform 10 [Pongo abelii]|uniref:POLR1D isoform 10 n=5 Tax=Catarrhini TaxID=9526 RepID=A0A2J8UT95_PONAB|nr:LOW QUALITY PROTEIN: POLR1D isoform 10 [Pongo abelii]
MEEDQELERKAIEELLKEAKRGKTRAETMGPMGCLLNMKMMRMRTL